MLFDLRAPGRKRVVQVIYLLLAFVLVAGIFVGVGTGLPSFLDSGTGTRSGDPTVENAEKRVRQADQRLAVAPKDQRALLSAASNRYDIGASQTGDDAQQLSAQTLRTWRAAAANWTAYLDTNPDPPDASVAGKLVLALQELKLNDAWADTQGIVTAKAVADAKAQGTEVPSASYVQLVQAEIAAKRTRQAKIHEQAAIDAAQGKEAKDQVRQQIAVAKDPSKAQQGAQTQTTPKTITVPEKTTGGG